MKLVFPFQKITTNFFGGVFRPYAKIAVYDKRHKNWLERIMLVDSGADYTLFPRKDAAFFGIDIANECVAQTTFGVGGAETVYLYKKLKIKLKDQEMTIPVGFLDRNDIPALLGRQKFLELLTVLLKDHITTLEL